MTVMPASAVPEPAASRSWRWVFGTAVLDERGAELTVGGEPVKLGRRSLQVLRVLLEHAGEVVTREELLDQVWGHSEASIGDQALESAMKRLRAALNDREQIVIETRHRFGYRLAVPVRREFIDKPAPRHDLVAGDHPPLRPQWKLVERIGSGGYGELWLVRHDKTRDERVYKFALDGAALNALKREITLNRLLRDNLPDKASAFVRLLDWNLATEPYFAEMEYLPAGSLTQWAERQGGCAQVPLAVRTEIAAQIAEALGLAHSVGVLHKDLKPGNVLIDARVVSLASPFAVGEASPAPDAGLIAPSALRIKLCDFGSGGVLNREDLHGRGLTPHGFSTSIGLSPTSGGTPMYLAPEVQSGESSSMAADCYSFGVLLYQLVAGDLNKPLVEGWTRNVSDELLRQDIAALVDGDPKQRVHDAMEVARRLRNLEGRRAELAQQRRQAQQAERLRTALERSRVTRRWSWAVAGIASLGLTVAVLLYVQGRHDRDQAQAQSQRAESEAASATAVNEFLLEDLIGQASPLDSGRVDLRVREVLDRAVSTAGSRFAKQPDRERAVRLAVGRAYLQLGEHSLAETQLRAALALTPESEPQQRAAINYQIGDTLISADRRGEARAALSNATSLGDDRTRLMAAVLLAAIRTMEDGEHAVAARELVALRPQLEAQLGAEHPNLDVLIEYLSAAYVNNGQYKEGIELARELVRRLHERHGPDDPRDIQAQIALGAALLWGGQSDEGAQVLASVMPRARTALGENDLRTLGVGTYLAMAYDNLSRTDEAFAVLEPTFEALHKHYGAEHIDTLSTQNNLAILYLKRGDFRRAIEVLEPLLAMLRQKRGESNPDTLNVECNLAFAYAKTGNLVKAEAMQTHALDLGRKAMPEHWQVGEMAGARADSLAGLGRVEEADALYEEAIQRLSKALGADHRRVASIRKARDAMRKGRDVAAIKRPAQ